MRRIGLGIFLFAMTCGLLQAAEGQRASAGLHMGILVPSLNRLQDSDVLSNWRYDVGWGLDLNYDVSRDLSLAVFYDLYPMRYHGLADRSDVRLGAITGRVGIIQHFGGEVHYNFVHFDSNAVFTGASYDYFLADQTVSGSYFEGAEQIQFSETAKLDKGTIGVLIGISSQLSSHVSLVFRLKPIFYWWNDRSQIQFITAAANLSIGYMF